jgi:hypothetical protein
MEEKVFHLDLNEQELNVVWQGLMGGSVQGKDAIHVVTATQKIQMAVNTANAPKEPEQAAEPVEEVVVTEEPELKEDAA